MEITEEQFNKLEFQLKETNAKMDKMILLLKQIAKNMGE